MLFLLDANVLIDANRDYYPLDRIPEFWEWLQEMGARGEIKIPVEIFEEVKDGTDDLATWINQDHVRAALVLDEEADVTAVTRVVEEGYAPDLSDDEVVGLGRDPFLVSYGLSDPGHRSIVTTETSKPTRQRANRHLPDVCRVLGVPSCHTFEMIRRLNFSTNWRS